MYNTSNIAKPKNNVRLLHADGNTQDIVNSILWADRQPEHRTDTMAFAPQFKTLQDIWKFVRFRVNYVLDPLGEQYIKSPSATWKSGFADCKSRSLFITSILKNLGIPYAYRFASYTGKSPFTHVYVIAYMQNGQYILDPDMHTFNIQKPTSYSKDYNMSEISYVSGHGVQRHVKNAKSKLKKVRKKGMLHLYNLSGIGNNMNELDMELAIRKQREQINKDIIESVAGIGCPKAESIQNTIDVYDDLIEVRSNPKLTEAQKIAGIAAIMEDVESGAYDISGSLAGIGDIGKKSAKRAQKKVERKAKRAEKKAAGKTLGQKLKKVGKKVLATAKKVGKTLLKVATAPQRLAVKGVLEVLLPKIAPLFIYLFVRDQNIVAKLPAKARKQRKVAERLAKFIVGVIGMKEAHFMGIIRNGIMKRYKQSPEQVLSKSLKMNINGIGDVGFVQLIPIALTIIKKLMSAFKKKGEDGEGDLSSALQEAGEPDLKGDFEDASPAEKQALSREIQNQPKTDFESAPGEPSTESNLPSSGGGGGSDGEYAGTNSRSSKLC